MNAGVKDVLALMAMSAGFGAMQPLGKIAASTGFPPVGMLVWQFGLAALALALVAAYRRAGLPRHFAALRFYLGDAVLGTLAPGIAFYVAVVHLPAGILSLAIAAVPLMVYPLGLLVGIETLVLRRLLGLAIGFAGFLIIGLPEASLPAPEMAAFLPLALLPSLFYALEAIFIAKYWVEGMDTLTALLGVMLAGVVLSFGLAAATGQLFVPPAFGLPVVAMALGALLNVGMYALFYWLIARAGPVFAAQNGYLIPISGLIWAAILLGERVGPIVALAAAVVLAGVVFALPRREDVGREDVGRADVGRADVERVDAGR